MESKKGPTLWDRVVEDTGIPCRSCDIDHRFLIGGKKPHMWRTSDGVLVCPRCDLPPNL